VTRVALRSELTSHSTADLNNQSGFGV